MQQRRDKTMSRATAKEQSKRNQGEEWDTAAEEASKRKPAQNSYRRKARGTGAVPVRGEHHRPSCMGVDAHVEASVSATSTSCSCAHSPHGPTIYYLADMIMPPGHLPSLGTVLCQAPMPHVAAKAFSNRVVQGCCCERSFASC